MALENITIVLVNPKAPGNVGSTARAMKNLGLSNLTVIGEERPLSQEARTMARGVNSAGLADPLLISAAILTPVPSEPSGPPSRNQSVHEKPVLKPHSQPAIRLRRSRRQGLQRSSPCLASESRCFAVASRRTPLEGSTRVDSLVFDSSIPRRLRW